MPVHVFVFMYACSCVRMDVYACICIRMDGDGWMDGWINGLMD